MDADFLQIGSWLAVWSAMNPKLPQSDSSKSLNYALSFPPVRFGEGGTSDSRWVFPSCCSDAYLNWMELDA